MGLDLQGGSQLTLQIIKEEGKVTKDELDAVNSVIDRRVNNLGVSESNLQTLGGDQLILELPGEQNPLVASRVLGKTALLEFRTQKAGTSADLKSLQLQRLNIKELIEIKKYINKEITNLFINTDLSGKDLINAGRRQEQTNSNWEVLLTFSNSGGDKFAELTKTIAGTDQLLAIILDGESISEASVGNQFASTGITGGSATISGNFSAENARDLEVQLKGGSLPLPIEIVETNTIGALLGSKNILKSLYAAISGLIIVGIFMILNYRILGFVSVLSLVLYGFFNLALYSLIPVTLTLPGISGLILSIGMAVDANILIFERIREELCDGNTLTRSIDSGFQRANSSIVDGHITTLLSCFVLFLLGTNFVKGFAATLGIGVLTSLFTSLNCSKTILRFLITYQSLRQKNLYLPKNNFLI